MSRSTTADTPSPQVDWPALPVETDIYVLPDGRVVVADLPAELVPLLEQMGTVLPCAIASEEEARTATS